MPLTLLWLVMGTISTLFTATTWWEYVTDTNRRSKELRTVAIGFTMLTATIWLLAPISALPN